MIRIATRALPCVTVLLLAACGSRAGAAGESPAANAVDGHPSTMTVERVSADGRSLTVSMLDSACDRVRLVRVDETTSVVTLRLSVTPVSAMTPPPSASTAPVVCSAAGRIERFTFTLKRPIRGRRLDTAASWRVAGPPFVDWRQLRVSRAAER
jgi:hypothetical protein